MADVCDDAGGSHLLSARAGFEQPPGPTPEVAEVDPAGVGRVGEAAGEVERVHHDGRLSGRLVAMSCRMVRSVREATIGAGIPSTQTRVRRPSPRSSPRNGSSA
jgi:hypothetical protein